MRGTIKLTFGEESFEIRPLTMRQVEALEDVLIGGSLKGTKQGKAIIAVALSRHHGEAEVDDLEATPREIGEAVTAILKHGGFAEDVRPGEAAPAGNAPNGERYEAA